MYIYYGSLFFISIIVITKNLYKKKRKRRGGGGVYKGLKPGNFDFKGFEGV